MPRFKCTIEYDGAPYAGWQWQDNVPSAQGALERAIFDTSQERLRVHCAGRTDAGVHATGQVVHFDLAKERSAFQMMEGINYYLHKRGEMVRVVDCCSVDETFHARFSAKARAYEYVIINRRAPLALDVGRAWRIGWPLDVAAMREGAAHLIGKYDFSSFRAVGCQNQSPVKTLSRLDIVQTGDEIRFFVEARSFLYNQVRIMVGSLENVGNGKWEPADMKRALEAKDRTKAGQTAPACGLYLTRVDY